MRQAEPSTTDLYDALSLEVERAEALTAHLAERLSDLSDSEPRDHYALSLIAQTVLEKLALIREKAQALRIDLENLQAGRSLTAKEIAEIIGGAR